MLNDFVSPRERLFPTKLELAKRYLGSRAATARNSTFRYYPAVWGGTVLFRKDPQSGPPTQD